MTTLSEYVLVNIEADDESVEVVVNICRAAAFFPTTIVPDLVVVNSGL
jgi:hypothetical protein